MTLRRRAASAALALAAVAVPLLLPVGAQAVSPPAPGPAAAAPILFGLHDHTDADRHATERRLAKRCALVGYFTDWDHGLYPPAYLHKVASATGAVPIVATGPTGYAPLSRVINGTEDAKAAQWAEAVKAYGRPVMIRLMAEMNGPWEPWSTGRNGNTRGQYVAAWRHIVDLFRAHGATNAIWVWNPDRAFPKATPMRTLYPGASYVDWIGVDVYNFNKRAKQGWLTFDAMMRPSVRQMRATAGPSKPLMVNEAGTVEDRRKPAWIKQMYASLHRYKVKAVVYFDENRREDWRLTSTAANRAASRFAVHHNGITGAGELPLAAIERIVAGGS